MEGSTWQDLFRSILGWVDSLIFGFISSVYNTFTNIANYTFIDNGIITEFNQRIYMLLGVFMLFRLAFSFINYFINPDSMTDNKSGVGNLVQRVVISLVLLVLTPTLFNLAFKIQTYIVQENILANLILGGQYDDFSLEERQKMYSDAGKHMAFTTLSAFMHPEDENLLNLSDEELEEQYDDKKLVAHIKEYKQAAIDNDIDALVGWYKLNTKEDENGNYIFSYSPILSTIAGIMIVWILIVFCIDIGVRSVKLAFLQLIAPIPIIGYIDNSKGGKAFKTWYESCFTTYLELFLKLLAIYFVIFVIALISKQGILEYAIDSNGDLINRSVQNPDFFAKVFIILGLLIFANEVPKLIGEMFGVKSDGFSLNPMKRINASPIAAGIIGGAIGAGVGTVANTSNLVKNIKSNGLKKTFLGDGTHVDKDGNVVPDKLRHKFIKGVRVAGSPFAATAGTRAFISGIKGGGKGSMWGNVKSGLKASNDARYRRGQYAKSGYTFIQRGSDKFDDFIGYKNTYAGVGKMDEDVEKLKNRAAEFDTRENRAREQMMDFESKYANKYGAETFNVGFARDEDGNLLYQEMKGDTDFQKYINYMNEINKQRYNAGDTPITTIVDESIFENYRNLENNVNYYNQEHEKIKKEIKNKEKIINTRKSKKDN